ncbi:hypothetical protein WNY58_15035 [Neptuniibacter pectenicola]|uniref:Hemerythrin HHE cation binding domain-containing protein n=1 Tax=Neptuniibacter pectenicola TaxID=1806669 RepID=A0ABU9TX22_9GAMM|nr:hypothetical protein [Neptuniibacter pectenicola]KXJ51260.1 MAG: hypothetical protein AXW15_04790 [Neptuniibacter sp. Phe_28]
MKRSEILKPLSREHHVALVHAKRLLAFSEQDADAMLSYWQEVRTAVLADLNRHFEEEELLVQDIDEPLLERFHDEHRQLRGLMQTDNVKQLTIFAMLLTDHIRFEERELFPCLETLHYNILDRNRVS